MDFAWIKDGKCINVVIIDEEPTEEEKTLFIPEFCDDIVECPEGFGIGTYYINGKWSKELPLLPSELRKKAYETMVYKEDGSPLIKWENQDITVDQANKIYLDYLAEGSEKASEIQALISDAKTYIRELYHD